MKYVSTRGKAPARSFSQAMEDGIAPDGGLYVPEAFPEVELSRFSSGSQQALSFPKTAAQVLAPFFKGDPLETELAGICDEAFDFPIPLVELKNKTSVLELFHGPTAAFKDVGARFLARCFSRLAGQQAQVRTILVATSGDTGGAVAAAFFKNPGTQVVVLYPKGGVSPLQEKQLTCWGENILSLRVSGSFDDCQRMVKEAFAQRPGHFSSANSISIARLLPQMAYYAVASLEWMRRHGEPARFVIPAGNLGNAVGCFWAWKQGFPIEAIALASNVNAVIPTYLATGHWKPAPSLPTLANAMDVGNPSNGERLIHLFGGDLAALRKVCAAASVSDSQIRAAISEGPARYGRDWCPHTATAVQFRERLPSQWVEKAWILVATAHPAKFESVVEPVLGRKLVIPSSLETLLTSSTQVTDIGATSAELLGQLDLLGRRRSSPTR